MDYKALYLLARIPPLTAWSVCGLLIAGAVAIYGYGICGVNWWFFGLVVLAGVLMQYVAHPLNDLMDLEVDRDARIEETSRVKVLLNGMATDRELKVLSIAIVGLILVIAVYLSLTLPLIPVFAAIGFVGLFGYNYVPLRLAYYPFTEWYLALPANAALVVAGIYAGTGEITVVAILFAIIHGFTAGSFFVTMMSMDFFSDIRNKKITTVGKYPHSVPCTIYPLAGFCVVIGAYYFYLGSVFPVSLSLVLFGISLLTFWTLTHFGSQADRFRHHALGMWGDLERFEEITNDLRMNQLTYGALHAVLISTTLILWRLAVV